MTPKPGARLVRHVGDTLTFRLAYQGTWTPKEGWSAFLRTQIGHDAALRSEILRAHRDPTGGASLSSWEDLPMETGEEPGTWDITVPLAEVGYFRSKAYVRDDRGFQHWPNGSDFAVSVHPSWTRSAGTIYCAWPRLFGLTRKMRRSVNHWEKNTEAVSQLDQDGYTVIPPSGTFRDLQRELPHIIDRLGCRIVHLLPVNPTPTTNARMGRYGSPYAVGDLMGIDPALAVFDQRSTGVEQFEELAKEIRRRCARLFLDVVINHTGWFSREWETRPDWFVRESHVQTTGPGKFESPGAWGTVWEDLVEFRQERPGLTEYLAEVFLTWCRRGVHGFRCDAGYKIPVAVWRYITATVREEFPETVFLLEGLGGSWEATEMLLGEGGMQWAYSELFQNDGVEVLPWYLDYASSANHGIGTYIHYSETHDNSRLAAHEDGVRWARYRHRLCALNSLRGGFGFTAGCEWLADEKINVHGCSGLNWGADTNLVEELGALNRFVTDHPCYLDGACEERLSKNGSSVIALFRESAEQLDRVLILINPHSTAAGEWVWSPPKSGEFSREMRDPPQHLLRFGSTIFPDESWVRWEDGLCVYRVAPRSVVVFGNAVFPQGLSGDEYRHARARADWAVAQAFSWNPNVQPLSSKTVDWMNAAREVDKDPILFLSKQCRLARGNWEGKGGEYQPIVVWRVEDTRRIVLLPPDHVLLIMDDHRFELECLGELGKKYHANPIPTKIGWIVALRIPELGKFQITFESLVSTRGKQIGTIQRLPATIDDAVLGGVRAAAIGGRVLLTNGRGGMVRMGVRWGNIQSKYDCALGANLNPTAPVDRHIFVKRLRGWVMANGFLTNLDQAELLSFEIRGVDSSVAQWRYQVGAGGVRLIRMQLQVSMIAGRNTVCWKWSRESIPESDGLPVSLTLRPDLEDRGYHSETHLNEETEAHFSGSIKNLDGAPSSERGFVFHPGPDRQLRIFSTAGLYHSQPEWVRGIRHEIEANRGQMDHGDAYSPGWFELPLRPNDSEWLILDADPVPVVFPLLDQGADINIPWDVVSKIRRACNDFVVRRDQAHTVIAGYPWFLDWGRDTLIAARGLLADRRFETVASIVRTFARWEDHGTLPNALNGNDASNRETSDAPLWFAMLCEEIANSEWEQAPHFYSSVVDERGRTLAEVLRSIATGYLTGTSHGIRVDPTSALVWSPAHFTWMDTNYPAGTPRAGYPVEIQALWIRLLQQVDRLQLASWEGRGESWGDLARRAENSFHQYFWLEEPGWYSDVLIAPEVQPARISAPDGVLRSNVLIPIVLGLNRHAKARERSCRVVDAVKRHLLIPGALRSLAPLPAIPPHPIFRDGRLLNDPDHPYWPRYEGDEDTRRKPAYHNGTAWLWTFPMWCEALVQCYPGDPMALAASRAYLSSSTHWWEQGCIGQLPEIVDGDAPHVPRGCDAQAWSVTEWLRVWYLLSGSD